MVISVKLRAALLLSVVVLLLAGCGDPPGTASVALPEITMTSGGGFASSSKVWKIFPDGSWTWAQVGWQTTRGRTPPRKPARSGQLTETQRSALARLATDPRLRR